MVPSPTSLDTQVGREGPEPLAPCPVPSLFPGPLEGLFEPHKGPLSLLTVHEVQGDPLNVL